MEIEKINREMLIDALPEKIKEELKKIKVGELK